VQFARRQSPTALTIEKGSSAMYLLNKYTRWYFNIINAARNRNLIGYCDTHHIIPRSLGGNNDKDNLVDLTPKEHFICHLLLVKMVPPEKNKKLVYAAWCMANQENPLQTRYKLSSRTYEWIRFEFAKRHSEFTRTNNPMHDPEVKKRHTEAILKRGPTKGNTGKKHGPRPDSVKEILRQRTKESMTPERRQLIRQQQLNRTPEQKAKYAFANSKRISCIYCKGTHTPGHFYRWHGDRCKHK